MVYSISFCLYFRFGDLEDTQRMPSQTSSNPQGRLPLYPLHSASQETATLLNPKYWMLTQRMASCQGDTELLHSHFHMFKTQSMTKSLTSKDLASAKLRIEIILRKYSAKSLRGSDSSDTWMFHPGHMSLAFIKELPALPTSKCGRSPWLESETVPKPAPNKEGTGASTGFGADRTVFESQPSKYLWLLQTRQSHFSQNCDLLGISSNIWQMSQTRCSIKPAELTKSNHFDFKINDKYPSLSRCLGWSKRNNRLMDCIVIHLCWLAASVHNMESKLDSQGKKKPLFKTLSHCCSCPHRPC